MYVKIPIIGSFGGGILIIIGGTAPVVVGVSRAAASSTLFTCIRCPKLRTAVCPVYVNRANKLITKTVG